MRAAETIGPGRCVSAELRLKQSRCCCTAAGGGLALADAHFSTSLDVADFNTRALVWHAMRAAATSVPGRCLSAELRPKQSRCRCTAAGGGLALADAHFSTSSDVADFNTRALVWHAMRAAATSVPGRCLSAELRPKQSRCCCTAAGGGLALVGAHFSTSSDVAHSNPTCLPVVCAA